MKVVDVNPFFYPYMGGIEHRMHLIAKEMVSRGHDVTIVTGRLEGTSEEEITSDGYRVIRLPSKFIGKYNPPYITSKGLLETLESIDADIVNYNYRWAPSYNKDMKKYAGKKVFTYHNMWGEGVGWQHIVSEANDRLFRSTLLSFDHIISVSDYVREDLIRRGIPGSLITTATPCLGTYPECSDEEGDYILFVGRLVRTKGLDYLVEAMRDVDCKLIICGKGPDMKRLQKKIAKFDLSDKVELKGWVPDDEKEEYMKHCRIAVMPSVYESYGLAAQEMLSYGRPVVCTDVNGLPDTVGNGGLTVKSKDPKALSDAMNKLLGDEEFRRELGHNARLVAESRNVGATVNAVEQVYTKVLNGE